MSTQQQSTEENKRVVRRFFEGTQSGNLDLVDELVTDDIVTHGYLGGNPSSLAEYKGFFEMISTGFPDADISIETLVGEGDHVAVRFAADGTHGGEFMGIPATGHDVSITGTVFYRLTSGKIAEAWLQADFQTLWQQLGAIPLPGTLRRVAP